MNVKVEVGSRDLQARIFTRERLRRAILLILLNLFASVTFAQQAPPGRIAYTKFPLGGMDLKELWLVNSDNTNDYVLSPQILYYNP